MDGAQTRGVADVHQPAGRVQLGRGQPQQGGLVPAPLGPRTTHFYVQLTRQSTR